MGRPKNSKVRHGMASCVRYGCERPECLEARRRARDEIKQDARNGLQATVPSDRASTHVQNLRDAEGLSATDIAALSGVSLARVKDILNGVCGPIYRTTEEAVMGVRAPVAGWVPAGDGYIDATGTRRRLQALSVQGFPLSILTAETELAKCTISDLRSGNRAQVMLSGMRVIRAVHDRLWDEDPTALGVPASVVTKTRTWAAKYKWLPTEAWSDIDDPNCAPVLNVPRYVALTEDAEELINQQGYTRKTAAERLGVERNTLDAAFSYYNKVMAKAS